MSEAVSFVFAFVLMLGILIFIHELGHFAAAKYCGVRVLKFSLGFGSPVGFGPYRLRWEHAGTEYVVGWIPLGGYVKMLGENPGDEEGDEALASPDEVLNNKKLWQKLLIVFAGPVMNLVLPIFLFGLTLFIGINRAAPVIGNIERGSPAAEADLLVGDRVEKLNGKEVVWWDDVAKHIAAHPNENIQLDIVRNGEQIQRSLRISARHGVDEFNVPGERGWLGIEHMRLRPVVGVPDAKSQAAMDGLRSGDEIKAVNGQPVEDWNDLRLALRQPGVEHQLSVERSAESGKQSLEIRVRPTDDLGALGILPATALVSGIEAGAPADKAGIEAGDLILTVDGEPVGSFESFAQTVRASGGRELSLVVARDGELHSMQVAPVLIATDTGVGVDEDRYRIGIAAQPAVLLGAVAQDQVRNPLKALPRAVAMTWDTTKSYLRGLGKIITGEISRKQVGGPILIAEIAHNAMKQGWEAYLSVLILISINLGILNLLPVPVLDGGQAVIFLIEGVKRSPLSLRSREIAQQVGLSLLLLLMGLAFWNDIGRSWGRFLNYVREVVGL